MWRYLWLCPVYLAIASLPLVFPLGQNLEYEYALTVGILAVIFIPLLALLTPAEMIPYRDRYAPYIKLDLLWIFFVSPLFLVLPGAFVFGIGACQCSGHGYLFWLILQAYPAWILSHGIYHYLFRARCQGWSKTQLAICLSAIYLTLVCLNVMLFWFNPQVRLTDAFLGFLHGPIYDAWIPVDDGIVLARVSHLLLGCAILSWAFYLPRWWPHRTLALLATLSWLGLTLYTSQFDSVGLGKDKLVELLPGKLQAPHFTMHYVPTSEGAPPPNVQELYQEAHFHVSELRQLFGDDAPFVHIFVYPDQTSKKLWFGGGATDVADVQTPSIHITASGSPHGTLRHELVHALASGFGFHGLGFHPNMAFTEGLAVALAPEQDQISLHDGAAALITSKRIGSLDALFSPLFWQESGARAYTVAGSIILYLLDTYGIEPVKRLYGGEDWQDVFGSSKRSVLIKWRDSIFEDFDKERYELYAEALYRHPGLLRARCPHTKATYRQSRNDNLWVRLRQPLDWDPAKDYWPWRLRLDPSDRSAQLTLWSNEIKDIAQRRPYPDRPLLEWRDKLQSARQWPPKSLEDVNMAILQADITRLLGDVTDSTALLTTLLEYAATKGLGDDNLRRIQARLAVDLALPKAEALVWRRYLAGWTSDLPARDNDEPWIISYLRLRRGTKQIRDPFLLQDWIKLPLPSGFADTFFVEWYRFIGLHAMDIAAYQLAGQAFSKAVAIAPLASKEYYKMQARRAQFAALDTPSDE